MIKLIGLTGAAGAGKDTVADMIDAATYHQHINCTFVSFAEPIRKMAAALLVYWDVPAEVLTDPVRKNERIEGLYKSPRRIMQTLGTEWGREIISESLWIDTADRRIAHALSTGRMVVVTDVRFENEAALIKRHGGQVWHINRPGVAPVEAHISEQGLPVALIDRYINNNGTLQDLRYVVDFELRQQSLFGAAV